MSGYDFDFQRFGELLLSLLPQQSGYVVVMDRTEWHFGAKPVNVLMIGFAYKGIAFPVLWKMLSGEGSSSTGKDWRRVFLNWQRRVLINRGAQSSFPGALPAAGRRRGEDPRARGGPRVYLGRMAGLSVRAGGSVRHSHPLEPERGFW